MSVIHGLQKAREAGRLGHREKKVEEEEGGDGTRKGEKMGQEGDQIDSPLHSSAAIVEDEHRAASMGNSQNADGADDNNGIEARCVQKTNTCASDFDETRLEWRKAGSLIDDLTE